MNREDFRFEICANSVRAVSPHKRVAQTAGNCVPAYRKAAPHHPMER